MRRRDLSKANDWWPRWAQLRCLWYRGAGHVKATAVSLYCFLLADEVLSPVMTDRRRLSDLLANSQLEKRRPRLLWLYKLWIALNNNHHPPMSSRPKEKGITFNSHGLRYWNICRPPLYLCWHQATPSSRGHLKALNCILIPSCLCPSLQAWDHVSQVYTKQFRDRSGSENSETTGSGSRGLF